MVRVLFILVAVVAAVSAQGKILICNYNIVVDYFIVQFYFYTTKITFTRI